MVLRKFERKCDKKRIERQKETIFGWLDITWDGIREGITYSMSCLIDNEIG